MNIVKMVGILKVAVLGVILTFPAGFGQGIDSRDVDTVLVSLIEADRLYWEAADSRDSMGFTRAYDSCLSFHDTLNADPDAARRLRNYHQKSIYRAGWCLFRLGEISGNYGYFDSAFVYFDSIESGAPDGLWFRAQYLKGEIDLQRGLRAKFERLTENPRGLENIKDIETNLSSARSLFEMVAADPNAPRETRVFSAVKREEAEYELAKLYQCSMGYEDIAAALSRVDYDGIISELSLNSGNAVEQYIQDTIMPYREAMLDLERFFILPKDSLKDSLLNEFSDNISYFLNDSLFRKANLYHAWSKKDSLKRDSAIFYDSASVLPESNYWRGILNLVGKNWRHSISDFGTFINHFTNRHDTLDRVKPLLESAYHKRLVLKAARGDRLTDSDWEYIQNSFTAEDYFFIVRFAAAQRGRALIRCVAVLDSVRVNILKDDSEENKFLKGIMLSFKGDFTDNADDYDSAATILKSIDSASRYYDEARYIRGRALCRIGAQTGTSVNSDLDTAVAILSKLVDEKYSLRALFFLGEAYKNKGVYDSALACFSTIFNLSNRCMFESESYDVWYQNSSSARSDCLQHVSNGSTSNINIPGSAQIKCEDTLLIDSSMSEPELLQYERLADQALVLREYARRSLEELKKFNWPQKSFNPLPDTQMIKPAIFYENRFNSPSRGAVTDSINLDVEWWLHLKVYCDSGVITDCQVLQKVDNVMKQLKLDDSGRFISGPHNITDRLIIHIKRDQFYPRAMEIRSRQTGILDTAILLSRQVSYQSTRGNTGLKPFMFEQRPDKNPIYKPFLDTAEIGEESDLFKDFKDIAFRDCDFDGGDKICAVNADDSRFYIYDSDNYSRADVKRAEIPDGIGPLNSPEGITFHTDGICLVADWGNHRIVKLLPDMEYLDTIRKFTNGVDTDTAFNSNDSLIFPTRIAVERDLEGVSVTIHDTTHDTLYGEDYYLVADRFGLHKFDGWGNYLGSPYSVNNLKPDEPKLAAGSFYGFAVTGYGKNIRIIIFSRDESNPLIITRQ